jgi:hypothetical protein
VVGADEPHGTRDAARSFGRGFWIRSPRAALPTASGRVIDIGSGRVPAIPALVSGLVHLVEPSGKSHLRRDSTVALTHVRPPEPDRALLGSAACRDIRRRPRKPWRPWPTWADWSSFPSAAGIFGATGRPKHHRGAASRQGFEAIGRQCRQVRSPDDASHLKVKYPQ